MRIAVVDYFANVGGGRRFTASLVRGIKESDSDVEVQFVTSEEALRNQWFGNLAPYVSRSVGLVISGKLRGRFGDGRVLGVPGTWRARAAMDGLLKRTWYDLGRQVAAAVKDADAVLFAWPDYHAAYPVPKPFVATVHDLIWRHNPALSREQVAQFDRRVARLFDNSAAIVTLTRPMRQEMETAFPGTASKTRVIYQALPTLSEGLSAQAGDEWLAAHCIRTPFVLAVGGLWAHKNHRTLVEAMGLLKREGNMLQLVCSGPQTDEAFGAEQGEVCGEPAADLRERALAVGLEPGRDIVGLGNVSDSVLAALYESAGCLVIPSTYEGGSLPMLEATARGCAVACSNLAVLLDAADYNGFVPESFPPLDAQAMARAVNRVMKNPPSAAERERRAKRVQARTWAQAGAEYLEVLRAVV